MSPPSVHILGIGNLGKLLAHSLRKNHPDIPVTLLFHRPGLPKEWDEAGRRIEIERNGKVDSQSGFSHEDISEPGEPIENLIVATKAHRTTKGIRPLQSRLGPSSTMLFLQNGLGTIDEVTSRLFPEAVSRPKYFAGIVNHGVYATSTFSSVHAGMANAVFAPIRSDSKDTTAESELENPLIKSILTCPELAATFVSSQGLLYIQLQKLAVNAVINPLTSILDCPNGELFVNPGVVEIIDRLLAEISKVILATIKSQDAAVDPKVLARFSQENLRAVVHDVGARTAHNISSMRQDVLAKRKTELDYINGYIVAQGAKFDIPCLLNAEVINLIKKKKKFNRQELIQKLGYWKPNLK